MPIPGRSQQSRRGKQRLTDTSIFLEHFAQQTSCEGRAARFLTTKTLSQFEHFLHTGATGHGPIPASRWNSTAFYNEHVGRKESLPARKGYFLREDVARFDARFFGIPPRDAHGADPQQRLLLQTTYAALENAGLPLEQVRGSNTSVYVSLFSQDYYRMGFKDLSVLEGSHVTGTCPAMLSNRISYVFDFTGPSITLDTACVSLDFVKSAM